MPYEDFNDPVAPTILHRPSSKILLILGEILKILFSKAACGCR